MLRAATLIRSNFRPAKMTRTEAAESPPAFKINATSPLRFVKGHASVPAVSGCVRGSFRKESPCVACALSWLPWPSRSRSPAASSWEGPITRTIGDHRPAIAAGSLGSDRLKRARKEAPLPFLRLRARSLRIQAALVKKRAFVLQRWQGSAYRVMSGSVWS